MSWATLVLNINFTKSRLLLKRDLHTAFNQYLFSINPDVCTPEEPISCPRHTEIIQNGHKSISSLRTKMRSIAVRWTRSAGTLPTPIMSRMNAFDGIIGRAYSLI